MKTIKTLGAFVICNNAISFGNTLKYRKLLQNKVSGVMEASEVLREN